MLVVSSGGLFFVTLLACMTEQRMSKGRLKNTHLLFMNNSLKVSIRYPKFIELANGG